MSAEKLKQIVEAALLAAGRPLSLDQLQALFDENAQPDKRELREVIEALSGDYDGHGIEVREVGSGFRIQVRTEYSPWVSRLYAERPPKYSRALLETLALIAYRQPITRGEIEDIRGVSVSSNIIKTLTEREWVRVVGHRDVPGRPALYATTKEFLDYFNLKSLSELPTLAEIRDLDSINRELELKDPDFADQPQRKSLPETPDDTLLDDEPMTGFDPDGETGYGPAEDIGEQQPEEQPAEEPVEAEERVNFDPDGETDSLTGDEYFPAEKAEQPDEKN